MIITLAQLQVFVLILARIIGIFIQAPLFNARSFLSFGKVAFAIWLAMLFWFVVPISPAQLPSSPLALVLSLISEVAIGFLIGFVCNLIFIAIQSAGEIMDLQMGLSVATAFDPVFGTTISVVGRLAFYTGLIIFITADGHHLILSALHKSFNLLPLGVIANFSSSNLGFQLIKLGTNLWFVALMLAAPSILMIFLSDFSFGIVSRVAPQVNVFMLGFQVKPVIGIIGFLFALPLIAKYILRLVELMSGQLLQLLVNLR